MKFRCTLTALTLMTLVTSRAYSDEGMWLFNNPPRKILKERYGFEPSDKWLEHVQKSSVRFNAGGSGSFVSGDGLVMTNHHVGATAIQKLSTKDKNLLKDGFLAKSYEEELPAVDEELNVLMEIVDVTDQVKKAVPDGATPEQAFEARRAIIAKIESESEKQTGLRSNVVTLYQGGMYNLYRFKRYTDVRLVFAPEQQIAFYGGDADNFAFPRYDLDVCFFRVYENGKPAKIEHYLKWSKDGAKEGDLAFVSGHPGHTDRLNTVADLQYLRDVGYPFLLQRLNRLEVMLTIFSGQGEEEARRAKDSLFSVANGRKARSGGLEGLQDPAIMAKKIAIEEKLKAAVAANPSLKDCADAWDTIARIQKIRAENIKPYTMLEGGSAFNSSLFGIARTLVRAADEAQLPNEKRLQEFQDSDKKSLELKLFSKRPIYDDFELHKLNDSLSWMCEILGYQHPIVQKVLAGKSPRERAGELIRGTKLADVDVRKKLYTGGKAAIDASDDSMILLAKLVDPEARAVRKIIETQVEEPKRQAYDKIAKAKFAVEGTNTYPDATFTLRLAFGECKGYTQDGKKIPFETQMGGIFPYAKEKNNAGPFELPKSWVEKQNYLNPKTPFNFVCTADIIGGNSGSPVINRDGEVIGLIFDGNIQSLIWDFIYTDEQARAVSVASPAITEALSRIYGAESLARELTDGGRK
jgi:hypothetical protein